MLELKKVKLRVLVFEKKDDQVKQFKLALKHA